MNCEIAYLSQSGHTAALAEEIAEMLSDEEVHLTDLAHTDMDENAEVYLIGFGIDRGSVPMRIMDALEQTEGKIVLLFVTSGMEPTAQYKSAVERKVLPFLPDECDYRGLFLCPAQFSDDTMQRAQEMLKHQPEHPQAQMFMENYQKTCGHPNDLDIEKLREFIWETLEH